MSFPLFPTFKGSNSSSLELQTNPVGTADFGHTVFQDHTKNTFSHIQQLQISQSHVRYIQQNPLHEEIRTEAENSHACNYFLKPLSGYHKFIILLSRNLLLASHINSSFAEVDVVSQKAECSRRRG